MTLDGRTYSDPSYGSRKTFTFVASGALNGTSATAVELERHTFMQPVTVTDWNLWYQAGGTSTTRSVTIGKSLGGTGAVVSLGTIAIGTQAIDTVKDGSATATDFVAGDDLVFESLAGTSTTVENVLPRVQYIEKYDKDDN